MRIIKKSDGSEAFTRTIKAGESNISLPGYITDNNTDVTNTLTYTGANGTDPGNVTFSFVNTQSFSKSNLCLLTVDFKTFFSSPRITS